MGELFNSYGIAFAVNLALRLYYCVYLVATMKWMNCLTFRRIRFAVKLLSYVCVCISVRKIVSV